MTSTSQPIASTSSATDAFDAVVQAANPSHPNHAAWVERYGGSISRKISRKVDEQGERLDDDDGEEESDHLEKSIESAHRRRRPSSNGALRNVYPLSRVSPARERASSEAFGRVPSRESSIRTFHQGVRSSHLANATTTSFPEENDQRGKKKKKKRDKGKGKGEVPPIPPPRTTSQVPPSLSSSPVPQQYLYPGHASTSTLSTMHANTPSIRQIPSLMGSPLTPSTSLPLTQSSSVNSRNNSISNQGEYMGSIRDSRIPSKSPRRPKHQINSNDPPIRLSSIVSCEGTEDSGWANTAVLAHKSDFSPTQSYSNHTISRRNSRKSVDFALPEESQRRGQFDKSGLRKSFDNLVSPFRDASRHGSISRNGYSPKSSDQPKFSTIPILKSPTRESSLVKVFEDQNSSAALISRPLSSVQDEAETTDTPIEKGLHTSAVDDFKSQHRSTAIPIASPVIDSTKVPTHPLALIASPGARSESMTEEGDDFFDAESDEGGNGTSADDRETPKNFSSSAISQGGDCTPKGKKKIKRKTSERQDPARTRSKSNTSGLGVVGLPLAADQTIFPKLEKERDEAESSTSEFEGKCRDLLKEGDKNIDLFVKDFAGSQSKHQCDKGKNYDAISGPKTMTPTTLTPTILFKSHVPTMTPTNPSESQRNVLPLSRKEELRRPFPSQSVNASTPDRTFLHDDENSRRYPFETSPSSFYFPSSNRNRIIPSWNKVHTMSAKSAEQTAIVSTSLSIANEKEKNEKDQNNLIKSVSKSGKGAFAGVMARMRRDRSSNGFSALDKSGQLFDEPPAMIKSSQLNDNKSISEMSPSGIGIAARTSVASVDSATQRPSKGWRTRLISFSQKGTKSPKNISEEWKREGNKTPPLPPLPFTPLSKYKVHVKEPQAGRNAVNITHSGQVFDDSASGLFPNRSRSMPLQHEKRTKKELKVKATDESPTIHKTLSPALLTERNHEADEVASFVGSEKDRDSGSKRDTWTTLNHFELPPDQTLDRETQDSTFTSISISKEDVSAFEVVSPISLTARRFANADVKIDSRHANHVGEFGLRKAPPNPLRMPPPVPSLPKDDLNTVMDTRSANSSPISRRSMDVRMYRSGSNPLTKLDVIANGHFEGHHHRGHSFALHRDQQSSDPIPKISSKVPFSPSSIGASRIGKRLFSGGIPNKSRLKTQGISSDNFHLSEGFSTADTLGRLPYSKSEICLVKSGRNHNDLEGRHFVEASRFIDDSSIAPSQSSKYFQMEADGSNNVDGYRSIPVTPKIHYLDDEEASTFDKMLRERAKDDAARIRQITAQARVAQQSPV